jgi:hypothetical protein
VSFSHLKLKRDYCEASGFLTGATAAFGARYRVPTHEMGEKIPPMKRPMKRQIKRQIKRKTREDISDEPI